MSKTILCIEDDESIAELIREVLIDAGYQVEHVGSGARAADVITEEIDAIICDLDLPGRSGLAILGDVRALSPSLPFVVLTAFGDRANQIEARRLGCNDFLTKPVDFELLLAVLDNVLRHPVRAKADDLPGSNLTVREVEIFGWVVKGKSSSDIAEIVGISERTVNFHVEQVMRKFGVGTRMQAAIACVSRGIIRP